MKAERGGALPGLLAFGLSMLLILALVYAFFQDTRQRYLEPMQVLRQGRDSLSLVRRDSLLADSIARDVAGRVKQTLAQQADSLRSRRRTELQEASGQPRAAVTPEKEQRILRLSAEDEEMLLRVLRAMEAPRAARQIQRLGPEAAAGILSRMSGRQQTELLGALPSEMREEYRRALQKRRPGAGRS